MGDFTENGDSDSLFGSPTPSPRLGCVLELPALPGSPVAASSALAKNVGTIALPGSHVDAENVVSLPASPPRAHTLSESSQRPTRVVGVMPLASSSTTSNKCSTSRRRKPRKASEAPPAGPAMSLPDAMDAMPPNLLRNQQALLGLAGVVAGIHPANLPRRGTHGSSAADPIVVQDEIRHNGACPPHDSHPPASQPKGQTIADALISQGDVFPVLRSLLPFLNAASNARRKKNNGWARESSHVPRALQAPPLKRRRLKKVPAGAKDWAVPYPFEEDEGPPQYFQTWEKEKVQALMIQLNSLVRQAVEKATVKEYGSGTRVTGSTTPISATASTPGSSAPNPLDFPMEVDPLFQGYTESALSFGITSPQSTFSPVSEQALFDNDPFANLRDADLSNLLGAVNSALAIPNFDASRFDQSGTPSITFSPTASDFPSPLLSSSTRLSTPCDPVSNFVADKSSPISVAQEFILAPKPINLDASDAFWSSLPSDPSAFHAASFDGFGMTSPTNDVLPAEQPGVTPFSSASDLETGSYTSDDDITSMFLLALPQHSMPAEIPS